MTATAPKPVLPGFAEELPGFEVLRRANKKWTPTPFTGVEYMLLSVDQQSSMMTTLLRIAPGAVYPPHHHTAREQCWVLEGDVRHTDDSLVAHAGDFFVASADSDHIGITSRAGCLLLIVSSSRDYVL
jgi:anti-sigma factor ChrR (cupin superfamily)